MQSKSSIFILIVVVLLGGGGLAYSFTNKTESAGPTPGLASGGLVSTNTGQSTGIPTGGVGSQSTGDQVVALLRNLSTIQLNDAVFQHPGFGMLRDITITLPPVTSQGRRNPFAPLSGDNAAMTTVITQVVSSTTTSATGTPATGTSTTTPVSAF